MFPSNLQTSAHDPPHVRVIDRLAAKMEGLYTCKHCCTEFSTLDNISGHTCFREKEVYMDCNRVLFTVAAIDEPECSQRSSPILNNNYGLMEDIDDECSEKSTSKQQAVWTNDATLALLSLYEANKNIIDNPKKRSKLWEIISKDLLESFGIMMTKDQVRWKMNALIKKYKEYIDNASKSGRGTMDFEWHEQMEEIFGYQRNAVAGCTISSTLSKNKHLQSAGGHTVKTNIKGSKNNLDKSTDQCSSSRDELNNIKNTNVSHNAKKRSLQSDSSSTSQSDAFTAKNDSCSLTSENINKRVRPSHGTGSKIGKARVELEKQWIEHLKNKENREATRDERNAKLLERKKESLQIKKKQLAMKEKELHIKKEIAENKMKEKTQRHSEILELERMKYQLLRKFMKKDSSNDIINTSDSDN